MADPKRGKKLFVPMYLLNWIFGMGIIEYPLGTLHPRLSFFVSLFCIAGYCFLSAMAYPYVVTRDSFTNSVLQLQVLFFSCIVLTVSFVALGWYYSEGMQRCAKKSRITNDLLEDIGIFVSSRLLLKWFMGRLIICISSIFAIVIINLMVTLPLNSSFKVRFLVGFTICYPVLTMFVGETTFIVFISASCYRFRKLNAKLKSMFVISTNDYPRHEPLSRAKIDETAQVSSSIAIKEHNSKSPLDTIKLAKKIHFQLCSLCKEANATYQLQILISIAVAFAVITGHLYNAYTLLLSDNTFSSKRQFLRAMAASLIWTVYFSIKMWAYSWVCSHCMESSSKTGDLINRIYDDPSIDSETQEEIRDFNIQLIQSPLKFTACGFISLDFSLMRMMVSTITTYLMILIQLRSEVK